MSQSTHEPTRDVTETASRRPPENGGRGGVQNLGRFAEKGASGRPVPVLSAFLLRRAERARASARRP